MCILGVQKGYRFQAAPQSPELSEHGLEGAGCTLGEGTIASEYQWSALPWSSLLEGSSHRLDHHAEDRDFQLRMEDSL